ncbi:hypothetical protein VB779_17245 [Haloarculaceae archaeon H-GB11]|nr:hypothetical protein [Haloarculaceae archaeon H-GB11]
MSPPTRRRVLQAATGLATGLAGCLDGTAESTRTSTAAADQGASGPANGKLSDPETVSLRATADRIPVWLPDGDSNDDEWPTQDSRYGDHVVIDAQKRADRVEIADLPDSERARTFLDETDYAAETVYLETMRIEECFRLELCHVSWASDSVGTDYARDVRSWDEACAADERVAESWLIRIPDAIDRDEVHGYSSSMGTGSCSHGPSGETGGGASTGGANAGTNGGGQ